MGDFIFTSFSKVSKLSSVCLLTQQTYPKLFDLQKQWNKHQKKILYFSFLLTSPYIVLKDVHFV